MSIIRPFKGIRPKKEYAEKVASPPYDVMNSEEAREMAKGKPNTFLHVVKPEIDLPPDINLYDEQVYKQGRINFDKLLEEGVMFQEEKPCFYLYQQKMGDHVQLGLVAAASVDEYQQDKIKKHEFTRRNKEDDRLKHVMTLNAQTGPVFLTYNAVKDIDALFSKFIEDNEPVYDFTSEDGIKHTFWVVDDEKVIKNIESEFGKIPYLYVADGHHRSAAASRAREEKKKLNPNHTGDEEYNYFLSVIFPHDQMYIMDYNRIVADLKGNNEEEFMKKVSEKFEIEEFIGEGAYKPEKKHDFGMYLNEKWYKLTAKEGSYDAAHPVKSLDAAILQDNLLNPILGIEDPRTDDRVDFVGGIRGLGELEKRVKSGKFKAAFSLYPTSIRDLMSVADSGNVMPPKSTWFEPKLRSGMVVHSLD